ncbi:MAG: hypothetical protein ACOCMX_02410 [Acetivibrio ethanolgignens]
MRLRKIEPGIVIHCNTKEEMKELSNHIEIFPGVDHIWNYRNDGLKTNCILLNDECKYKSFDTYSYFERIGKKIIEFSDLILPELTLGEAWSALGDISDEYLFDYFDVEDKYHARREEIICGAEWSELVDLVNQWKADHEKKEPEIETVDICRIIEIMPDGKKRCVHEEDIKAEPELPYGNEQIAVHEILKRYCMEHDGDFIAVHEVVSRVKKV